MSDVITHGPRNPGRLMFVATALVGIGTGIVTADVAAFALAVLVCGTVLCAGYALLRRRFGWTPLNGDDLFEMVRLLSPF